MNKSLKVTLLLLPLFALGAVQAEKVFTWKDDKGITHYSDRPSPTEKESEVIISIDYPATSTEEPEVVDETSEELSNQPDEATDAADPDIIAYCNKLKGNLKTLFANERIRLTNEDGSEVILEAESKKQEIQRTEALLKEHCQ